MVATPRQWKLLTQANTSDGGAAQFDGQVVGLVDGGYVVVWTDGSRVFNPGGSAVVAQQYNALGEKVGGEHNVSQFVGNFDAFSPAVTQRPDGSISIALVVLPTSGPFAGNPDIHAFHYDADFNFIDDHFIDFGANRAVDPAITGFADGSYVVSYTIGTGNDTDIVGRFVNAGAGTSASFEIFNDTDNSSLSELATLSNGNFVAVFQSEAAGSTTDIDILYRIMTPAGGSVDGPTFVTGAFGLAAEVDPDVAALKGGGFVVVWTDTGSTVSDIRATIFTNTGDIIGSDILVNTTTAGAQDEASVTALADGGFVVTWEDEGFGVVWGQRFGPAGSRIGSEFLMSQSTDLSSPEAALLRDGRFAFASGFPGGDEDVVTGIWDARNMPTPTDFSRDLASDILWRHASGEVNTWDIRDGARAGGEGFGTVASSWHIEDTGDFNGDGHTDILWRNVSGEVNIWELHDGVQVGVRDFGVVSNDWHIV
jgi:hypothetical protein